MEEILRARDMYGQGFTVARCLAAGNMSHGTFYYWLDGGPRNERGEPQLPPIPRRRVVVGKRRKPLASSQVSLAARLTRTAERAAFDIKQRLAVPSAATPARERDVRMLASLVQSLRSLMALVPAGDDAARRTVENAPEEQRDMDAFREQLARRIHNLIDARIAERAEAAGEDQ
jgi:hypothetical protein